MTVFVTHYVDYDGCRIGRTWEIKLFSLHHDAMEYVNSILCNEEKYPDKWETINTYRNEYESVPSHKRVSPVWGNWSYGHGRILFVTKEEVL